jgi:hypothetical protein
MGYCIYIKDKNRKITENDFHLAVENLMPFYKGEIFSKQPWGYSARCDIKLDTGIITLSGSFSVSGEHAEGCTLNMLINLQKLGYRIDILSEDFCYV